MFKKTKDLEKKMSSLNRQNSTASADLNHLLFTPLPILKPTDPLPLIIVYISSNRHDTKSMRAASPTEATVRSNKSVVYKIN
jgi:hypothetical protein